MNAWIGVDLDSTLAIYTGWEGPDEIGEPIPAMVDRVKAWLDEGRDVRIFTARVAGEDARDVTRARRAVERWCKRHVGRKLPVTCSKDWGMVELWDDRCVQVEPNTGRILGRSTPTSLPSKACAARR